MMEQENKILPLIKGKKERLISLISFVRNKILRGAEVDDLIILEKGDQLEIKDEVIKTEFKRVFKKEEKEYVYLLKEILDCFGDFEEEKIELIPKRKKGSERILTKEEFKNYQELNPDNEDELKEMIRNSKSGQVLEIIFKNRPLLNEKAKDTEAFKTNLLIALIFLRPTEVVNVQNLRIKTNLEIERNKLENDYKLPRSITGLSDSDLGYFFKAFSRIFKGMGESIEKLSRPKEDLDRKELKYIYSYGLYMMICLYVRYFGNEEVSDEKNISTIFPLDNDICQLVGFIMSEWGMYDNMDDYKKTSKSWRSYIVQRIKTNIKVAGETLIDKKS